MPMVGPTSLKTNSAIVGMSWVSILLLVFIINIIIQYISLRFQYKPLYNWWSMYGGAKYDKFFSVFTLAAANTNIVLYYIDKITTSPMSWLTLEAIRFIYIYVLPDLRYTNPSSGIQEGYITPRILCSSILPSADDGDYAFINWFKTATRASLPIDSTKNLTYTIHSTPNKNNSNIQDLTFTYTDPSKSQGLWPDAGDRISWMGLIFDWLNGTDGGLGNTITWVWQADAENIIHPVLLDPKTPNPLENWNNEYRADNFIYRLHIDPNSSLIVYYVSNQYSTQSIVVDPIAFSNMITPAGALSGGFLGFLKGLKGSSSSDDYASLLYSTTYTAHIPNPPTCTPPNAGRGVVAGLGSTISSIFGIAMMAAFAPIAPEFLPMLGLGVLGLGSAAISGYNAGKGTCP